MKETIFYILVSIKTARGFECIGKFYVGNNRLFANNIFKRLKGQEEINEKTVLTLDLMETQKELPVNMQMISCSLNELTENCRIIVKETFKLFNLEDL